jgi:hypothetical protein
MAYDIMKAIYECTSSNKDLIAENIKESTKQAFEYTYNKYDIYIDLDYTESYIAMISDLNAFKYTIPLKKLTLYPYDNAFELLDQGDYVSFDYSGQLTDWLVLNLDKHYDYNVVGRIYKSNNVMKWINDSGEIISYPCIFNSSKTGANADIMTDKYMEVVSKDRTVFVQKNDGTLSIDEGDRFIFGSNVFRIGHIDDYGIDGVIQFYMEQDQSNDETDNFELGIANYYDKYVEEEAPSTDTIIINSTPDIEQIKTNESYTFALSTTNEGVEIPSSYTISLNIGSSGDYEFSSNVEEYTIVNNGGRGEVIVDVYDSTNDITEQFIYELKGLW